MNEPGQHSGGAGETEMSGVLGQLERLMRAYNDLAGKRQGQGTQIVPDTDVPRSMFLEIESWDPDEPGALPVTAFFQMFDDVAGTLTQVKKMRLLRAKTKGTAKQFLIDNAQSHAGLNPYDEARQAMLAWFETENPVKAAASLCTARVSQGEGLRQFAERVHRLARSAVKEEGPDLTNVQKQNWIRRKTLKAFVKGLPRELGSLLTNNPPETLEAALKRAEELRETLDLESDDDAKWGVSAVTVREERRCYECGVPVPNVEIPMTTPDPKGTIKGNDPEMAMGSDAVEAGIRMGHPVTHWPSGDVGFRRIGAMMTGRFSYFGEDAEEFPIERWDGGTSDARVLLDDGLRYLEPEDRVYLKQIHLPFGECRKLWNPWSGPWVAKRGISVVNYEIHDVLGAKSQVVHINRLKPAMSNDVPDDAVLDEPVFEENSR
ncbi:hypothetical protein GE061_001481, partial [Apolygus lucorum]